MTDRCGSSVQATAMLLDQSGCGDVYLGDSPPCEQLVGDVKGLARLGVWRGGVRPMVLLGEPWRDKNTIEIQMKAIENGGTLHSQTTALHSVVFIPQCCWCCWSSSGGCAAAWWPRPERFWAGLPGAWWTPGCWARTGRSALPAPPAQFRTNVRHHHGTTQEVHIFLHYLCQFHRSTLNCFIIVED